MSPRPLSYLWQRYRLVGTHVCPATVRRYSVNASEKTSSRHAQLYSDLVPGMIPIALLGSVIFMGLRLTQAHLSHEEFLEEAQERVRALEAEIEVLRKAQSSGQGGGEAGAPPQKINTHSWWFW